MSSKNPILPQISPSILTYALNYPDLPSRGLCFHRAAGGLAAMEAAETVRESERRPEEDPAGIKYSGEAELAA
jgi:hypothetical protein